MAAYVPNITPVNAKITWDADGGRFRIRISTQVKRADGTHYEVEIDQSVDLSDLIVLLLNVWAGTRYGGSVTTAMNQPGDITYAPAPGVDFNAPLDLGTPGDVGTADAADDLVDQDLI